MINESTDKRLSDYRKNRKFSPNYRFHYFIFDSVTLKVKRESRREVQDPQMSSVVFNGSKLLKAAMRYGNMKLVTIRAVQVRGRGTPCS